ncbi:MAG TPA: AbrB family transcriptional regulator [Firmicutes bacterium]|jgi:AbrB family looped-hinge helix DNA binding protein|nr:AbrB family transcriptional regulator [Bacillota bacterium]HAW72172.1 AbrB family transcriptional regulator [Bacillota bacterium]HBE05165.1 AbrB family transcriptional regulator [Bacillota bacterium]HBL50193.1 AbrB family transcriptional regulator [Bacillota bacterium]HBL68427.1 AbrB family transcriptional regulator [Bacillota bacterium]
MLVELKQKSQVTIPKALVKKLNLEVGDKLDLALKDGRIIITPVVIIPKDQEWYYTHEWQTVEREADKQLAEGRAKVAETKEELYKDLGLEE